MMLQRDDLHGLKIAIVFGCLDLGGSERLGFLLARALKERYGAEVSIWSLSNGPGRLVSMCEAAGIPWRSMQFKWSRLLLYNLWELSRFVRWARAESPHVLLPFYRLPNLVCGLTWRRIGAKTCVWNQRDEGLLLTGDFLNARAVEKTPLFIANSQGGGDFLLNKYLIDPAKMTLVHNGVELPPPRLGRGGWRERLGVTAEAPLVCMVANFTPYKDHATLIRTWRIVMDECRSRIEVPPLLLLAGMEGDTYGAAVTLVKDLGLHDAVRFLGSVEDVAGLLMASDLYVHSSLSEGCPNAILEAMASGLPVVATAIPGNREAVGPEGEEFLVSVGEPRAMASAILDLLVDRTRAEMLAMAQEARAAKEFSSVAMVDKTVQVIRRGLSG
ncbi:glycosyltransferase [Desulfuromonas sp. DDH964]|uniref:glycosyltransferase n=1 Tax=Desulfuromonas sp. DDH964 TaxID=1823759 RepID=UPI00078E6117|nr:glycosyltransferase [Desulfuromonas sp. DDH964]AMV73144.1 glycosyltransferase [Desulfuromonas sp. DDH964]